MMSLSYESSIVMIVLLAIISFVFLQGCIFSIGNREISLAFMLRFLIRRRGIFRLMPRRTRLFFSGGIRSIPSAVFSSRSLSSRPPCPCSCSPVPPICPLTSEEMS